MEFKHLMGLVVVAGLLFVAGQYVASEPQRIAEETEANREITVQGEAEVSARPDVANVQVGVNSGVQPTADAAMNELTSRINAVIEAVEGQGVDEEDIRTSNFSLNPVYDFRDGQRTERGFEASEVLTVTVREIDSAGEVLAVATRAGANQLGGVQFEVDDLPELELEAQELAIKKARENAEQLTDALGVGLGRVKSFSSQPTPPTPQFARAEIALDSEDGIQAPEIPVGVNEVTARVTVTFELK